MKKFFLSMLTLCAINSFAQDLPTADAVIDKYLAAIGGKDAIAKIQDLTVSTTTETQMGTSETEVKYKFPDKYSTSTFANGMEIMSAIYDGNKFKRTGRFGGGGGGGGTPPAGGGNGAGRGNGGGPQQPMEGKDAAIQAARANIFAELLYDKVGITKKVVGVEKVGDKDAYNVEFTQPDGKKWNDFYEVESGLKVKSLTVNETPRGKFESIATYKDYKKFKGMEVMIPAKSTRTAGQMGEITSEVQSVKMNKGLKDADFVIKEN